MKFLLLIFFPCFFIFIVYFSNQSITLSLSEDEIYLIRQKATDYYSKSNYSEAVKLFYSYLKYNPRDYHIKAKLAYSLVKLLHYKEAENELHEIIKFSMNEELINYSINLLKKIPRTKPIPDITTLIRDPLLQKVSEYVNLANENVQIKNFDEALKWIEKAIDTYIIYGKQHNQTDSDFTFEMLFFLENMIKMKNIDNSIRYRATKKFKSL